MHLICDDVKKKDSVCLKNKINVVRFALGFSVFYSFISALSAEKMVISASQFSWTFSVLFFEA